MQRLIGKEWSGINVATRFVNNITESCDIQSDREREKVGEREERKEGGKEGKREGGREGVGEGESRRKWV